MFITMLIGGDFFSTRSDFARKTITSCDNYSPVATERNMITISVDWPQGHPALRRLVKLRVVLRN
jgi:hypothetical protein